MTMFYLGVDPGVSGGWALINQSGTICATLKMGEGPAGIARNVIDIKAAVMRATGVSTDVRALVEKVASSPQMGVRSAFTFGKNAGAILGALAAAGITVDEIPPQAWQKIMGVVYPKGVPRDKNVTKRRAQQVFPTLTVTHAIADALLLAECARRIDRAQTGTLPSIPKASA